MDFEVYCDESNPEILSDRTANNYLLIGSIWIPKVYREDLKNSIKKIKTNHNYRNEIKWNKVAPSSNEFYLDLLKYFFSTDNIRFRVLLVKSNEIDRVKFHNGDGELSFYKFYYQLLQHWILSYNSYSIFLDHKVNKDINRVSKLREVLKNANLTSEIANVQALPSNEVLGIQLADFLTGIVNAKFNKKISSSSKKDILTETENYIGHKLVPTSKSENKFNVFSINFQGGW
ncbi:MAG: hypothetical protein DRI95_08790 [Bacteroidetes bacterium]|nr:MAG: hypothetical protein DRI95_08790 [Bacteroidota bacterium]